MDYENERWMKVYTRDTGGWLDLSWQARGLSLELSRKLDAEGKLPLGKKGLPSLAGVLRGAWSEMKPFVEELIADERLVLLEGNVLFDPGHTERQSARASATLRKKAQRSRESLSRDVTRSHAASHDVTNGHDQIRREEKRSEETRSVIEIAPAAPPRPRPVVAEPVVEPIVPLAPKRKPETPCPASDATPQAVAEWARSWSLPATDVEFAPFLDHHRKSDARFRDWSAAWRTWLRNAERFARPTFRRAGDIVQSGTNRAWKLPEGLE